ncbi:phosphatase domain-containing putative toxin [Thioclava sp. FR2]|uniref:phosphatase domain-containing putative toxin n=1 Tax=Thioclava sp. FR2 TaxID=3445780 RepID=UPI003EBE4310
MPFQIAELDLLRGQLGICPMPGRGGRYEADLAAIVQWSPDLVLTMTTREELAAKGADDLPADLALHGIHWVHLPIPDFGTPPGQTAAAWPDTSAHARAILANGGRVLAHCMGGCGRSGMALLRLMVDAGEDPDSALLRLRSARPCAVETPEQLAWASGI